jgi:MFS family permease
MSTGGARHLPNARLRMLLLAWLLVGGSIWALTVALAVYAFEKSGAGAVGAVTAARLLPAAVVAPLTGRLVDGAARHRVVAVACGAQAVSIAAIAVLIAQRAPVWSVGLLAAVSAGAATTPRPGLQALLPALADSPEEVAVATAMWAAVDNTAFLIGAGVGGIAIAVVGAGAVAAGASLAAALAAVLALRLPAVLATAVDDVQASAGGALSDVLAGLRTVARTRLLHAPFALLAGLLVLEGTTDVQLVALALGRLGFGSGGPGVLFAVWGLGGVLASAVTLPLVRRRGYGLTLAVGAGVFAAAVVLSGVDGVPLTVGAMVAAGIGFALVETAVMAIIPRLADDEVIGRVYAVSEVIYAGAAGVGSLIAPLLIALVGVSESLIVVGAAYAAIRWSASRPAAGWTRARSRRGASDRCSAASPSWRRCRCPVSSGWSEGRSAERCPRARRSCARASRETSTS